MPAHHNAQIGLRSLENDLPIEQIVEERNHMNRIYLFLRVIIPLIIIFGHFPGGHLSQVSSQPKAHPLLLQIAGENPHQLVAVIVQKWARDDRLEARVAQLGGNVTKDLHIINAFAAEMGAQDALKLAKSDAVRWVSLDALCAEVRIVFSPSRLSPDRVESPRISSEYPKIVVSRLLKSWAIPPARRPTDSILWACKSCFSVF